jgi:hypothetical protein
VAELPRVALGQSTAFEAVIASRDPLLLAIHPRLRFPHALCGMASDPSSCSRWDEAEPAGAYDVVLWDVARGARHGVLRGHRASISGVVATEDGKTIITASLDTTLRVWDTASARQLATIALLPRDGADLRWVIMTPDGLFDGSPQGQSEMQWRVGDTLFRLEQYAGELYTPGLLARLLGGDRPKAALKVEELAPPPRVRIVSPRRGAAVREGVVTVTVEVEDSGGGKSPAWLYVNGRRVPATRARPLRAAGREAFEVELVEGVNHLRATAFNRDGTIESAGDEVSVEWDVPAAERPVLHVLAVGVDDYEDASLRLSFAGADAKAVSRAFEPGLFATIERTELVDRHATRAAIAAAIAAIAKRARPRDALVVYLAGHGALVGSTFYYLPADVRIPPEADLQNVSVRFSGMAGHRAHQWGLPVFHDLLIFERRGVDVVTL